MFAQIDAVQIESHFAELTDQVAVCGAVGINHEIFSEGFVLKTDANLTQAQLNAHARNIAGCMPPSHYVTLEPGTFPLNRVSKTDYVQLQTPAQMSCCSVERYGVRTIGTGIRNLICSD